MREPQTDTGGWPLPQIDDHLEPGRQRPVDRSGVPWHWWDAFVVFVLVEVVGAVVAGLAAWTLGEDLLLPVLIVASGSAMAGLVVLWVKLRYPGRTRLLFGRVPASAADLGVGVAVGLGAFVLAVLGLGTLLQFLIERSGGEVPPVQEQLQSALVDARFGAVVAFAAVVLAPLGEELLFRGLLFNGLRRSLPLWAATLLSGLLFAVTHVEWIAILVIFPVGVLFALAYHWRGTLLVPIAAHATFNLVNVGLLLAGG